MKIEMPAAETPELIPANEGPDVATLPRADALASFEDFKPRLEKLLTTARTIKVTDVNDKAGMALARTTRLAVRQFRIDVEHARKELGEEALRRKQKIDADAKTLKDLAEPVEALLLQEEQFAEREEARLAEERRVARTALLSPYADCTFYSLASMPEEAFQQALAGAKAAHEARLAEIARQAQEAEKARLAEIERQRVEAERLEAQRLENERLKKEAAEREAAAKIEREKAEAEARRFREEAAATLRRQVAEAEAARKALEAENERQRTIDAAKAKKEREAAEAKAREEAAARKKLEDEIAERKRIAQAEIDRKAEEARKLAAASDREKLLAFKDAIRNVALPTMANGEARALVADQQTKFCRWIEGEAKKL